MSTNKHDLTIFVLFSGKKFIESLSQDGVQRFMPRFQSEALEQNELIFERVSELASKKGCTPSQLALAWVHHQGRDVCPIPGTTKIENLKQNIGALSVKLTPEEMALLESYASADAVTGDRYLQSVQTWKESDTLDLSSWALVEASEERQKENSSVNGSNGSRSFEVLKILISYSLVMYDELVKFRIFL